jgi:hypothetical protein
MSHEDEEDKSSSSSITRKGSFALFRHQVAGHLPLFWSHGRICKPAFPTEIEFYTNVQHNLPNIVPFIPKFIDVVQLVNISSDINQQDDPAKWGILGVDEDMQSKINNLEHRYLVLQDLTYGYKRPCILDLKIGTRQHGINASAAKIKSKTKKVNSTTSKTLGLRVCGMQVYNPEKQEFVFRDKYFGRSLDADNFEVALRSYFQSGSSLRKDCVQKSMERLISLKQVLQSQSAYIFYACSILLIYEGFIYPNCPSDVCSDMRLIDFAHTYHIPSPGAEDIVDDSGVLYGLDTLLRLLQKFMQE